MKKQEEGVCPHCGSQDLIYSSAEATGESLAYPWDCPKCKKTGKEWYDCVFSQHIIDEEE